MSLKQTESVCGAQATTIGIDCSTIDALRTSSFKFGFARSYLPHLAVAVMQELTPRPGHPAFVAIASRRAVLFPFPLSSDSRAERQLNVAGVLCNQPLIHGARDTWQTSK